MISSSSIDLLSGLMCYLRHNLIAHTLYLCLTESHDFARMIMFLYVKFKSGHLLTVSHFISKLQTWAVFSSVLHVGVHLMKLDLPFHSGLFLTTGPSYLRKVEYKCTH